MRPLRYLNGRTPSPVPAEARHLHHSLVQMVGILRKMQFGTQPLDEAKRRREYLRLEIYIWLKTAPPGICSGGAVAFPCDLKLVGAQHASAGAPTTSNLPTMEGCG